MRRWIPWMIAGAALFVATKVFAQKKTGELAVTLTFKKLPRANAEQQAAATAAVGRAIAGVLTAPKACPGLPAIREAGAAEAEISDSGDVSTVSKTFVAEWTHDTLGPIKDIARDCLLRHLQSVEPLVMSVAATRVS